MAGPSRARRPDGWGLSSAPRHGRPLFTNTPLDTGGVLVGDKVTVTLGISAVQAVQDAAA
ncbi:hypothetical protein ACH4VM_20695 [Streptomyces sp. NPDC020792]|uniref:hypothetical protein n=1 Tax=Streptomyces sp. NPDC020792 TaxID=3365089 RepID=UPI00378C71C9